MEVDVVHVACFIVAVGRVDDVVAGEELLDVRVRLVRVFGAELGIFNKSAWVTRG